MGQRGYLGYNINIIYDITDDEERVVLIVNPTDSLFLSLKKITYYLEQVLEAVEEKNVFVDPNINSSYSEKED